MTERFCPQCGRARPTERKMITEELVVRGEPVTVSGEANVCVSCSVPLGDGLYDDLMRKAYDVYRLRHGLLSAREIRAIREGYGLSQALFAKILKIGEATLQRYERGSLPSLALHSLLVNARDRNQFQVLVEEARGVLSDEEYQAGVTAAFSLSAAPCFEDKETLSGAGKKVPSWGDFVQQEADEIKTLLETAEDLKQDVPGSFGARFRKPDGCFRQGKDASFLQKGAKELGLTDREKSYVLAA